MIRVWATIESLYIFYLSIIINWQMIRFILLILFLQLCTTQITPSSNQTLTQLAASQNGRDTVYSKAVIFLIKTHPELSNYTITAITQTLDRGNQTYANNLIDFHF